MAEFVKVMTVSEGDNGEVSNESKPAWINLDCITDFREWLSSGEKPLTVLFWKKHLKKPKTLIDISCDEFEKFIKN